MAYLVIWQVREKKFTVAGKHKYKNRNNSVQSSQLSHPLWVTLYFIWKNFVFQNFAIAENFKTSFLSQIKSLVFFSSQETNAPPFLHQKFTNNLINMPLNPVHVLCDPCVHSGKSRDRTPVQRTQYQFSSYYS